MADCEHSQHWSLSDCPGLTPEEIALGEKVRSVGLTFGTGGREQWHDTTIKEQEREIFANARKYGHEPPDYLGPRSKGRPLSEMKSEIT